VSSNGLPRGVRTRDTADVLRSALPLLLLCSPWALLGCPAANQPSGGSGGSGGSGASGGNGGTAGSGTGGIQFGGSGGAGGGTGDCTDEANKLIYVVSDTYDFYRYSPLDNSLTPIGQLACPTAATPFSMAVDRDGWAWVLHNDGTLFRVSTDDASCSSTTFVPNQEPGFDLFGMGFVSDEAGGSSETLFVGSYSGFDLGKIVFPSLDLSTVGSYDQVSGAAEITGTGDARLFGFFLTTPVTVAELDKTNAHVIQQWHPNVDIGAGWAFAAWGGAFYLFTAPNLFSSQIDRFDPMTNQTTTVVSDVGFVIVGAGVSTCAPVIPPN
jgi:hypothetical protein